MMNLRTFKTEVAALGEVRIRFITTFKDISEVLQLAKTIPDDRELISRLLHHQISEPEVQPGQITALADEELRRVTREYVERDTAIFKFFNETTEEEFFANVRRALVEFRRRPGEALGVAGVILNVMLSAEDFGRTNSSIPQKVQSLAATWQSWISRHKGIFDAFAEFANQYSEIKREAVLILKRYKWFLTPSFPIFFIVDIVDIGRRPGNQRHAINQLFIRYFTQNDCEKLDELVVEWGSNPLFAKRMKIIRDCVATLKNPIPGINPANLILPTLIAQIDGIQAGFMRQKGFVQRVSVVGQPGRVRRKVAWEDPQGNVVRWKSGWATSVKSNQYNTFISDLANETFLDLLFQEAWPGIPLERPYTFSRHKIMHGESLKYGRLDNVIRAFMILDFLAHLR